MNSEETIFAAAAELPPEQRAAHLDEACAGQPELRARVEGLLRSHEATGFMGNHSGWMNVQAMATPLGASSEDGGVEGLWFGVLLIWSVQVAELRKVRSGLCHEQIRFVIPRIG